MKDVLDAILDDALLRFRGLSPELGEHSGADRLTVDDLDVTTWPIGALPATGLVLGATGARAREELPEVGRRLTVVCAGVGACLVYVDREFAYDVVHPLPAFFDDVRNREVPPADRPARYFGWS